MSRDSERAAFARFRELESEERAASRGLRPARGHVLLPTVELALYDDGWVPSYSDGVSDVVEAPPALPVRRPPASRAVPAAAERNVAAAVPPAGAVLVLADGTHAPLRGSTQHPTGEAMLRLARGLLEGRGDPNGSSRAGARPMETATEGRGETW